MYKILNLSTGRCYNGNLPNFQHDIIKDIIYPERTDAEMELENINMILGILSNHNIKPCYLEIIEVEDAL
jgi:hypothetical protein